MEERDVEFLKAATQRIGRLAGQGRTGQLDSGCVYADRLDKAYVALRSVLADVLVEKALRP